VNWTVASPDHLLRRYAYAITASLLAIAVALALSGPLGLQSIGLLAFPLGVLAAAWLGGMGPGIVSALVVAVAIAFFFAKPVGSLAIESPRERIALAVFVMACVIESTLVGTSRRSERGLTRLTQAVSVSEEKYRLLFERNPEPMWIFDRETRVLFGANQAALAAYGYSAKEIHGMPVDALFEPEDAARFVGEEKGWDSGLWRHRTKNGARCEVQICCASAPWLGGRVCLMVVRDVTAQHSAEIALLAASEELRRAKDVAERATKARDRFLVVLSHELRTPLTPVLLASASLEARADVPLEIRRLMGTISAKVKHEARLIDNLVDVARIINGDFHLARKPTDATQIVTRAADECVEEARAKGVALKMELGATAQIVLADPERLHQAVTGLILNAIEAAPDGSTVRMWTGDAPPAGVAIGFRHQGKGVDVMRLFDPFERDEARTGPNTWELALGRVLSKAIVEACGGTVEASFDGERTTIVMHLPEAPLGR
jgi:PAS domain S-box-containing protein